MALSRFTQADFDRTMARAATQWGRAFTHSAARGWGESENIALYLTPHYETLRLWFLQGMILGHRFGRLTALRNVATRMAKRTRRFASTPYDAANDFMQTRAALTPAQVAELEWMYSPEAARVATNLSYGLNARLAATAAQATAQGFHVRAGMDLILGRVSMTKALAENLFRTQNRMASVAGQMSVNADPDVDAIIWGYEYDAIMDSRVRPSHAALDGTRYRKGDPRLAEITPPNGYNCRCRLIEIFEDERDKQRERPPPAIATVDGAQVIPGADAGFAFNPGDLFRDTLRVAT